MTSPKKSHKIAAISILLLPIFSISTADQLTYDGTDGPGKIELSGIAELDNAENKMSNWIGITAADKGVIFQKNNQYLLTQANLVIDYQNLSPTAIPKFVIGGYSDEGKTVTKNSITIQSGKINGPIYAGLSHRTIASSDEIKIEPATGKSETSIMLGSNSSRTELTAKSNANTLNILNNIDIEKGDIAGGKAIIWLKSGNATTYNNRASANIDAYNVVVNANDNKVILGDNNKIHTSLFSGQSKINFKAGNATTVSASNSNINTPANARVLTNAKLESNKNTLTIGNHNKFQGTLWSGQSIIDLNAGIVKSGNATAGNYTNTSTTAYISIEKTYAYANNNHLTLDNNNDIAGAIYAGQSSINIITGNATSGIADANTGKDPNASAYTYAEVYANTRANQNQINLGNKNIISQSLSGGDSHINIQTGAATAASTTAASGANAKARTDITAKVELEANNNSISIQKDSHIQGNIYGGQSSLSVSAGKATSGKQITNTETTEALANATINVSQSSLAANGNKIYIDGKLGGDLYGGHLTFALTQGSAFVLPQDSPSDSTGKTLVEDKNIGVNISRTKAFATKNIITLDENFQTQESDTGSLYGGYLQNNSTNTSPAFKPEEYDVFSGNTLNFFGKSPTTFKNIANFEKYVFMINPSLANDSTSSLMTADNVILGANIDNMSSFSTSNKVSQISVTGIHSGSMLKADDQFILMQVTDSLSGDAEGTVTHNNRQQGLGIVYDVETFIDRDTKKVYAKILKCTESSGEICIGPNTDAEVNPRLKSLLEGRLSAITSLNRGADIVAYNLIRTIEQQNNGRGFAPFLSFNSSNNRYSTGSHIKSKDLFFHMGVSLQNNQMISAVFLEGGRGNYDTYNSFIDSHSVRGDGHNRYFGVGAFAKYQFHSGVYTEASLRAGQLRNKFNSHDLINIDNNENARYRIKNRYFSAHLGAGYLMNLDDKNQLDISAKYLWTHLGGKNIDVTGESFKFESINSQRVRLQGGLKHQLDESISLHAGIGYEYEFDGKANGYYLSQYKVDSPSLKGSTGILSLGINLIPNTSQNLNVDFNIEGYVGKRRGISGGVQFKYYLPY